MILNNIKTAAEIKTGTIDTERFSLRYYIEGKGRQTIVIGRSLYYPRTFFQNIRKHLCIAFIDHRGFGIPPKRLISTEEYELNILSKAVILRNMKNHSFLMQNC